MIYNPPFQSIMYALSNYNGTFVGLDTETTGLDALTDTVHSIAISVMYDTYCLDVSKYSKDEIAKIIKQAMKFTIVMQNAVFDMSFIQTNFNVFITDVWDTMLASQILHNGKDGVEHNLLAILKRHGKSSHDHETLKDIMRLRYINHPIGKELDDDMLWYVGEDTQHLIQIAEEQRDDLVTAGLDKVMALECKVAPVIAKMQLGGCLIDVERWNKSIERWYIYRKDIISNLYSHLSKLSKQFTNLDRDLYSPVVLYQQNLFGEHSIVSDKINFSSQAQILDIFEDCDLPKPYVETKKVGSFNNVHNRGVPRHIDGIKYTVDETALTTYLDENEHTPLRGFLEELLKYREFDKLISTYGKKFLAKLDENNYIHTRYTQCRTKTGRLSSQSPNLQNIPQGKLRQYFIASPENVFVTCDMSSAEVAIAADYSGEPLLIDALQHGDDMHSKLASVSFSIIFGTPVTITKGDDIIEVGGESYKVGDLRTVHKTVLFAKFYKAGAKRVYSTLAYYINKHQAQRDHMKIAQRVSNALDKQMPTLTKYLTKLIKKAQKTGELRGSKLGRRRFFDPDVYGEAANYPIQNTNGEAMKAALINVDKYLVKKGYGRVVMTIHDEVVVEVPTEHAEETASEVEKIMADALSFFLKTVEGGASVNVQPYWEK